MNFKLPNFMHVSIPTAICVIFGLLFHASYLTSVTEPLTLIPRGRTLPSAYTRHLSTERDETYPDLFIFRRTKKSGSSSMINALMKALIPLGYEPIPLKNFELEAGVRNEYIRAFPRRLMTIHHNKLTKAIHPDARRVVIADTIRDGYKQLTSYCRHMRRMEFCNASIVPCFDKKQAASQMTYRFQGDFVEHRYNYIDLPLSSAHPALSTTVLRSVFPNVSLLQVDRYNARNTACPEDVELRKEYLKRFAKLDDQINMLRRRMLVIAGYPSTEGMVSNGEKLDMEEVMDAAELIEARKYGGVTWQRKVPPTEKSRLIATLLSGVSAWTRDEEGYGDVKLIQRRDDFHVEKTTE